VGDLFSDSASVRLPAVAPLALRMRERLGWKVVYDCMDEWTNFPGFGQSVLSIEEKLVRAADATVVSADRLEEKWKATAPRLVLARNGMDADHYRERYVRGREHEELYQLAEALVEWDERITMWRIRHYKVVARIIGDQVVGTQGTPVEVLGKMIHHNFFPALWRARNQLTTRANEEEAT